MHPNFSDLRRLRGAADNRCGQAYRPGTHANRLSHVLLFAAFTDYFQMRDFPASVGTLVYFGEFMTRSFQAPKSITNALSSLRTFHELNGLDESAFSHVRLRLFKRALPLTCRHTPHIAPPMPFALLERLCQAASEGGDMGLVFAALLAVTFFAMARLSSMVPPRGQGFDGTRYPTLEDVQFAKKRVLLRIKWAKAHQAAEDAYWVPLLPATGSPACPVAALLRLQIALGVRPTHSPLFGRGGTGQPFFTLESARSWLRAGLLAPGEQAAGYTFHSLRRGACTRAFKRGAHIDDIKNLGGWSSGAVQLYIPELDSRGRAASALLPGPTPS